MSLKGLFFTEKKLHFRKGEVIFKEHDEGGKEMYFIDSGRVRILKKVGDAETTLAILNSGDFFGEMGLITGNKRIASAMAFTDCKLCTMDKEAFESNFLNDKKFMRKILESLVFRLEETDLNLKRCIQRVSRLSKVSNVTG
ncbi:MAG: Crp/Fnr family transcriptional regulator [Candidatus Scalinduaceae bacterium]